MAFNNLVARAGASALVPEQVSNEMLGRARTQSAVLQMFRRIPVTRNQVRFPILSALPMAYWVTGDTGLKQTSEMDWANKFMNIEEIAVIAPIPDNVVADVQDAGGINLFNEMMPDLVEAFGRTLDAAVLFGINSPSSFPNNVSAAAAAAGNTVTEGATAAQGGFFGDIDATTGLIETDGFDPTGIIAVRTAKARFRASRNTFGDRTDGNRVSPALDAIDAMPIAYPARGLWPAGGAAGTNLRLLEGDWSNFVVGVRQDITATISKEAVVQDNTGAIVYNAFQQDLTFLRLTFRVGWQVSNQINYDQAVESARYPVARLVF